MIFAWRHLVYCANVYWAGAGSWDCLGAWDYQNITQLVNQTGYCSRKHFMLNMHPPVPCRHVVTSNNLISALIDPRLIFRGLLHNEACSQRTQRNRKDRGNFTVYTISTIKNFLAGGIFINSIPCCQKDFDLFSHFCLWVICNESLVNIPWNFVFACLLSRLWIRGWCWK